VSEAYTGVPTGIDPERLIASADASGVPHTRAWARNAIALVLVARGQAAEAIELLHQSLEITRPGLNRASVHSQRDPAPGDRHR